MDTESNTYDIIFAGGGATACITAGRLAEADPSLKILIIETGRHTRELHDHVQPGRFYKNLIQPGFETFSLHVGKPSEAVGGRSLIIQSGKCLGGGSSVNFAVYNRAAASDYDDWETVYGNKGWGSKDLIPLLKKAETYQEETKNSTHGFSGPLKISTAEDNVNLAEEFLTVGQAYDKNRVIGNDMNSFTGCVDKYCRMQRFIDKKTGRRSDVPHHYIYNQDHNKNLQVKDRHRVVRVLFKGDRAVGVEYLSDFIKKAGGVQKPSVAYASRLVVLSSGAFGSPAILERSGIGAVEILRKYDIQQIVDLPGVGENYMDHHSVFNPYLASEDADTMDVIFRGTDKEIEPHATQWLQEGKGLLSQNACNAGLKVRPTEADLVELGPTFENRWKTYFEKSPDKPLLFVGIFAAYGGTDPAAPLRKYFSMAYFSGYPASLGRVHITSASNPFARQDFEPGFLDDSSDLDLLRLGYKRSRELARRNRFYRGELGSGHPAFSKDGQAAIQTATGPVDIESADIVYTEEDNKVIDEFHRLNVATTWHSIGTCAMKAREQGGVVNERLNVYGVKNLKVADCSVTPGNVGANTYSTAVAIGEKAAVIIAEDLGIKGVTTC